MVLSAPIQARFGIYNHQGPQAARGLAATSAATQSCPILGTGPLSRNDQRLLLDILADPNRAISYLRANETIRAHVVRAVYGPVMSATDAHDVDEADLYREFIKVWTNQLTPAQAQVLSLMYCIGDTVDPAPSRLGVAAVADKMRVSAQCVHQHIERVAKKTAALLTGRNLPTDIERKTKVSLDISETMCALKKVISKSDYQSLQQILTDFKKTQTSHSVRVSEGLVSSYQLVIGMSSDENIHIEFMVYCEQNNFDLDIRGSRVNTDNLMKLVLNLLKIASYEFSKCKSIKHSLAAMQKLRALLNVA